MLNKHFSAKSGFKSFIYAGRGIQSLILSEHNMWIHLAATVLVICTGLYFMIGPHDWIAIIFSIGLVWVCEAFNTITELITDKISPEFDLVAGKIKDIAAGAVLIASITAFIIGCIIFFPKLL